MMFDPTIRRRIDNADEEKVATATTGAGTTTATPTKTSSVIATSTATTSTSVGMNHSSAGPTMTMRKSTIRNRKYRLIQVMNTYAVKSTNNANNTNSNDDTETETTGERIVIHQPYDQWSTLQSIRRAKQHAPPEIEVTLVCAAFPSDLRVLEKELEPICDRFFELNRSTVTEYGGNSDGRGETPGLTPEQQEEKEKERLISELFSKRELPMLQDLFDAAVSVAEEQQRVRGETKSKRDEPTEPTSGSSTDDDDGFFVMVTNSDIGLTKHFYGFLLDELEKGRKALTINRWSIPMGDGTISGKEALKIRRFEKLGMDTRMEQWRKRKEDEGRDHPITIRDPDPSRADELLDEIDAALSLASSGRLGKPHPGYDCFVIHSAVLPSIRLGNLFAGFPPWGVVLQAILAETLSSSSSNAYARIESSPDATFHLGDQGTWSNRKTDGDSLRSMNLLKARHAEDLRSCPRKFQTGIRDPYVILNTANCGIQFRDRYFREGLLPELREWVRADDEKAAAAATAARTRKTAKRRRRTRTRRNNKS